MKTTLIHGLSLALGAAFKMCYWSLGKNHYLTETALEHYRAIRRKLPGKTRGPNGRSTRYGAYEAYESTQES